MKIYDCFPFNGELDLLKLRLDLYHNIVDYHIIIESEVDFKGNSKPLRMPKEILKNHPNIRYKILKKKYFKVDDPWYREFETRNACRNELFDAVDEDIIFISDIDEIISPDKIKNASQKIILYELAWHIFSLNYVSLNVTWKHPVSFPFFLLKKYTINDLRLIRKNNYYKKVTEVYFEMRSAGSHFSYFPKQYSKNDNFISSLYSEIKNKVNNFPSNYVSSPYGKFQITEKYFSLLFYFGVDHLGNKHIWGKCKEPLKHFHEKDKKTINRYLNGTNLHCLFNFQSTLFPFNFVLKTEGYYWRFTSKLVLIYSSLIRKFVLPFLLIFKK